MLGFINFQLYHTMNLHYPPQLINIENNNNNEKDKGFCQDVDVDSEILAALTSNITSSVVQPAEETEYDEFPAEPGSKEEEMQKELKENEKKTEEVKSLFKKMRFYISREVPREASVFLIRCFGGEVSWDPTVGMGSTFEEADETITHQIVDRPTITSRRVISRSYVQPQWVFDCVNAQCLLPLDEYVPGAVLPPHLSPFVEEKADDYIPPERKEILRREKERLLGDSKTDVEEEGKEKVVSAEAEMSAEEKKLAVMMLPKKKKALYDKIIHSKKKKASGVRRLEAKRKLHD